MPKRGQEDFTELIRDLSEYHMLLKAYGKQADKELKHNVARLFKALSFSKEVQALLVLNLTGQVANTMGNIEKCLEKASSNSLPADEKFKEDEIIKDEADGLVAKFKEIEEKNLHLYLCAKDTLESHMDLNLGDIHVCSKCGYTLPGDAPKDCIVCHAPSGYFRIF